MATRLFYENLLTRRIPELKNVLVRASPKGSVVYVSDGNGNSSDDLIARVSTIIKVYHAAGWGFEVRPFSELSATDVSLEDLSTEEAAIATLGGGPKDDFIEAIVKLCPEIERLSFTNRPNNEPAVRIEIKLKDASNNSREVARIRRVISELLPTGVILHLEFVDTIQPKNDQISAYWSGHLDRRSTSEFVKEHDDLQHERFLHHSENCLKRTLNHPLPFGLTGNRVLLVSSLQAAGQFTTLLPLYD